MVWTRSGHKHWTSFDMPGRMLDVHVVNGVVIFRLICIETGEILFTQQFDHPIEAMAHGRKLIDHEVFHVEARKNERETSKSSSYTSNPEASGAI